MAKVAKTATAEEMAEWESTRTGAAPVASMKTAAEKAERKEHDLALKSMTLAEIQKAMVFTDASETLESDQFGPVLADKGVLVGTPFLLVEWEFHPSNFGEDFVTMKLITMDGRKYIVNDGSTGIARQLADTTAKSDIHGGMACRKGLRVSEYTYPAGGGAVPASTYYIDTSL